MKVVFSDRAFSAIMAETTEKIETETGGLFLGTVENGIWYVIEAIDPGPKSVFEVAYFEYDQTYTQHLINKVANIYEAKLDLIGLWHRHPGSFDVFSSTDNGTNSKYAKMRVEGAISALVNVDPRFRLTMYHVASPCKYNKITYVVGNDLIPEKYLRLKTADHFERIMKQILAPSKGQGEFHPSVSMNSFFQRIMPYLEDRLTKEQVVRPKVYSAEMKNDLKGRNTSQIALGLNDDNIPTPGQYFKGKNPDKKKYSRMSEKISWTASMVYKILTSYVYTGATVGHKRKSGGVGSRKTISQKKEDWIIVEGMHEAIVSKEEFELAQAVIRGGEKNPKRNLRYYPLKGLVCCGNCKRALTRRKLRNEGGYFYQCTHSTHDRDTDCPVGERYSEAWIEDTAYKAIGQMLTLVEKKAVKEHEISKRRKSAITECADTIRDLQKQSEQLKAVKLRLYEKYTFGSITKAEYLKRKAETDAKMSENEEAIRQGHERMQELDSEHPCSDERLDAVLGEYQKGEGLTYELAHALISAIYVHGHDSIEIVWMFKDIFEDAEI